MDYGQAKIIDYYLEKLTNTNFQFHEIRPELERNNIEETEIRNIIRVIDSELRRKEIAQTVNTKVNGMI